LSSADDFSLTDPAWSGSEAAREASDPALLRALLDVEVALAVVWSRRDGVEDVSQAVAQAAREPFDVREIALAARGGGNPVIPLVARLRERVRAVAPEAAAYVHRGATSQDVLDSALMLAASRARSVILRDVAAACASLAGLAEAHRDTLMVARSLTQHALPTTMGLKAATWLEGLLDARDALAAVPLPVQYGGAVGTLAAPVSMLGGDAPAALGLADALADELGLDRAAVPWHTRRTPVTRLGDALATLLDALGTIAVDVLTLARPEIAELSEPGGEGRGGSSAMPQKRNPVLSVLVHSSARLAPGRAADLHRSAVVVDERPDGAWHAEWPALRDLVRLAGGAAQLTAELAEGLVVHPGAMRRNLDSDGGLVLSERLMAELAPELGRERVQELVARAARGEDLETLLAGALGDAGRATRILDPADYLGAAGLLVDRTLERYRGGLDA